jgi:hypothetical protein
MSSVRKAERRLKPVEINLLRELLPEGYKQFLLPEALEGFRVNDLNDSGMGSVRFVYENREEEKLKCVTIVRAEYKDIDDVQVSVAINADFKGRLAEIDVWKTDFTPTIEYPSAKNRIIKDR